MACLIPRLIDPTSGRVRIDGHDLREVTLESIRAQVCTVLQADLVFTDSVLVNIGMGDPINGLPRVIEAAKLAHAHQFIQDLPHGYDTIIGPLGHFLKPDEQFRIALARAYLHDPSIVIVEEPAVAVDEETRLLLDDTLTRLALGRTLIVLPHRLSTIRSADQVIVLHDSLLEDAGPPGQLQTDDRRRTRGTGICSLRARTQRLQRDVHESGAQALSLLATGEFHGVVSDMRTPGGVDGAQVHRGLSPTGRTSPAESCSSQAISPMRKPRRPCGRRARRAWKSHFACTTSSRL